MRIGNWALVAGSLYRDFSRGMKVNPVRRYRGVTYYGVGLVASSISSSMPTNRKLLLSFSGVGGVAWRGAVEKYLRRPQITNCSPMIFLL
jgi:hypothetical protein